jgi:hypothetical protein
LDTVKQLAEGEVVNLQEDINPTTTSLNPARATQPKTRILECKPTNPVTR